MQGWYGTVQANIVRAIDLILANPDDYTPLGKCGKCGGQLYSYHGMVTECENVVFGVGRILDSGCNNFITGG